MENSIPRCALEWPVGCPTVAVGSRGVGSGLRGQARLGRSTTGHTAPSGGQQWPVQHGGAGAELGWSLPHVAGETGGAGVE